MKKLMILMGFAVAAVAQSHSVTLTWTDTINPNGTNYNSYRLTGTCPSNPVTLSTFTKLNTTPITAKTYVDTTVTGGTTYCYAITATNATVTPPESGPSNALNATVPVLSAPTLIQITILQ